MEENLPTVSAVAPACLLAVAHSAACSCSKTWRSLSPRCVLGQWQAKHRNSSRSKARCARCWRPTNAAGLASVVTPRECPRCVVVTLSCIAPSWSALVSLSALQQLPVHGALHVRAGNAGRTFERGGQAALACKSRRGHSATCEMEVDIPDTRHSRLLQIDLLPERFVGYKLARDLATAVQVAELPAPLLALRDADVAALPKGVCVARGCMARLQPHLTPPKAGHARSPQRGACERHRIRIRCLRGWQCAARSGERCCVWRVFALAPQATLGCRMCLLTSRTDVDACRWRRRPLGALCVAWTPRWLPPLACPSCPCRMMLRLGLWQCCLVSTLGPLLMREGGLPHPRHRR